MPAHRGHRRGEPTPSVGSGCAVRPRKATFSIEPVVAGRHVGTTRGGRREGLLRVGTGVATTSAAPKLSRASGPSRNHPERPSCGRPNLSTEASVGAARSSPPAGGEPRCSPGICRRDDAAHVGQPFPDNLGRRADHRAGMDAAERGAVLRLGSRSGTARKPASLAPRRTSSGAADPPRYRSRRTGIRSG